MNISRVVPFLSLIILACSSPGRDSGGTSAEIIRQLTADDFYLTDSIFTYHDSTLYQYINGADRYYIEKGILELSVGFIGIRTGDETFAVELYEFGKPDSAQAVFLERERFPPEDNEDKLMIITVDRAAFSAGVFYCQISSYYTADSTSNDRQLFRSLVNNCYRLCEASK
jgi:hypothetical protein